MDSIIFIAIFDVIILSFVFLKKNNDPLLYDITPEEQYAGIINEFEANKKAIKNIDISSYNLDSGHIYE